MWVSLQGDGTAVCLQNNPAVFTLSMHAANNFPARKQKSTLDVPLPDGMEDDDYLRWRMGHLGLCLQMYFHGVLCHSGSAWEQLVSASVTVFSWCTCSIQGALLVCRVVSFQSSSEVVTCSCCSACTCSTWLLSAKPKG